MKINSTSLQEVLTTMTSVIKLVKERPVTEIVQIVCADGTVYLGMTDNSNKIVAKLDYEGDDLVVALNATSLLKLVKMTTKEFITLSVKKDYIEFKGNGTYKLSPYLDENGEPVSLTLDFPDLDDGNLASVNRDVLSVIAKRNSPFLLNDEGHQEFNQYYEYDNKIITTDSIGVVTSIGSLFGNGGVYPDIIDKINSMPPIDLSYRRHNGGILVKSTNYCLFLRDYAVEDFPYDMIEGFTNTDMFDYKLTINKSDLLSAIKRQDLFKDRYNIPVTELTFTSKNVIIKDTAGKAEEEIEATSNVTEEITFPVATEVLLKALKPLENSVVIHTGIEDAIGLQDTTGITIIGGFSK